MQETILILNGQIINEGTSTNKDILIKNGRIEKIDHNLSHLIANKIIDASGKIILPGIIDDQVHFREPGLTHKGNIHSEAKAAVAGGVTTYMEMPNTVPNALTQELLEDKYKIAANSSLANYSFFMGTSNNNLEEIKKTNRKNVCGVKIFMGSSTGNMLVDDFKILEDVFKNCPTLIATHCEDEETIKNNSKAYLEKYGENMPIHFHSEIRNVDACYKSSSRAVDLAKKHNTRLHILHISTAKELELFKNDIPLSQKRITSEVCVHHLYFDRKDYDTLGTLIKWNPAVKEAYHKETLLKGLLDDKLDIIATDHAPHTWEEKQNNYWKAPSGGPLVQHALNIMLDFYQQGKISLEKIVEKMCHAPAICFQILERGFIKEGYHADLSILDLNTQWKVSKENIHYHCGWSPLESKEFTGKVTHTIVSGHLAYENGAFNLSRMGSRILFDRN
ncbi:MAG: dihydroorotase [Cytophagales bacterium]|nr:MAG: dihydroorotase [Cytophagales bacterium]